MFCYHVNSYLVFISAISRLLSLHHLGLNICFSSPGHLESQIIYAFIILNSCFQSYLHHYALL